MFSVLQLKFEKKVKANTSRIGIQTIVYGENFPLGLESTLKEIRDLGYAGIEFFQSPGKLGSPEEFERLMQKYGLTLLGLTGGSLESRRLFCEELHQKPKFIYIQDLEPNTIQAAIACGCNIGVHPIQYSKLDSYAAAVAGLKRLQAASSSFPSERFSILPDSGHLYLGNENLLDILQIDGQNIHYIHLKDWAPQFGTSMFSYARGFCELGRGIVLTSDKARKVLQAWQDLVPANWIIVEQDSTHFSPKISNEISIKWLQGLPSNYENDNPEEPNEFNLGSPQTSKILSEKATDAYNVKLLDILARANFDSVRSVNRHFSTILYGFSELADLKYANIWEINPCEQTAILRSIWQPRTAAKNESEITKLKLDKALCGLAVAEQQTLAFPDVSAVRTDGHKFIDKILIEKVGVQSMVSIPIPNQWNPHQPQIIINLFPQTLAEIFRNGEFTPRFQAVINILKPFLGITIERAWDQERAEIYDELKWIAVKSTTVNELLNNALEPIKKHIRCMDVGIFLLNEELTHMKQFAPSILEPSLITKGQDLIGEVWSSRSGYNTGTRLSSGQNILGQKLIAPIYRQGRPLREVMGVILCQGKRASRWINDFTVTDELILDAVQAALAPQLERMIAAERRATTMTRVNHELKGPLTFFFGANEAAIKEMREHNWQFKREHLIKMRGYLRLMRQVVAKATFLKSEVALKLEPSRTLLFANVINPAIDDLAVYLEDRQFRPEVIVAIDPSEAKDMRLPEGAMKAMNVRDLPPLFVDQIRFQQVVFNILSNAIKYAKRSPNSFKAEIVAATAVGGSNLIFRDWGIGIPPDMKEAIFLEGIRGPGALNNDSVGDGLGLFIVREILAAHGATIKVTNCFEPTEFTIFLPDRLADFTQFFNVTTEKKLNNT